MAKDPAMLWYWADWNSGTTTLNRFLKGCYMDLLHAQFNSGHLSTDEIKTVLGPDYDTTWPTLKKKFKPDKDGLFYNERLEYEKEKRAAYTESRRQSKTKTANDKVRVYFMLDLETGYVKIGSSKNPIRRLGELVFQKSDSTINVSDPGKRHYELLWHSELVERSVEFEIHKKYEYAKLKGEWFDVSPNDLTRIVKVFFNAVYVPLQRTIERPQNVTPDAVRTATPRMENENKNENATVFGNEVGVTGKKTTFTYSLKPDQSQITAEIFADDIFIENLRMTHRGKDILQAWGECFIHWTEDPNPPQELSDWKKKLNSWLSRKDNGKQTSKTTTNKNIGHAASVAEDFARRHGSKPGSTG